MLDYLGYIYNALNIQSLFDYGITIWGSCSKTYLQKLQRLQNRCARIVTGIHDYSVSSASLIHSLKWFTCIKDMNILSLYLCLNVIIIYCHLEMLICLNW